MSSSHSSPDQHSSLRRQTELQQEAAQLHFEMERIMKRRRELQEEQVRLATHGGQSTTRHPTLTPISRASPGSSARRAHSSGPKRNDMSEHMMMNAAAASPSAADRLVIHDPPGATVVYEIPTEKERRERLERMQSKDSIYLQMKGQMREAWHHDPMLVSGFFQLKTNNTKASTFGRQPRFQSIVGQKGYYYLSSDLQRMQSSQRKANREVLTATSRGRLGTNVNSHWNDCKGGGAPGPGAYTPRGGVTSVPIRRY